MFIRKYRYIFLFEQKTDPIQHCVYKPQPLRISLDVLTTPTIDESIYGSCDVTGTYHGQGY